MVIRSKRDAERFLASFNRFSEVDEYGKQYLVVANQMGTYTLMRRQDGQFTVHGRGEGWCDPAEVELTAEDARNFVWRHRKTINEYVKARRSVDVR